MFSYSIHVAVGDAEKNFTAVFTRPYLLPDDELQLLMFLLSGGSIDVHTVICERTGIDTVSPHSVVVMEAGCGC